MKQTISVRRLLNRRVTLDYLRKFMALLPRTTVALLDANQRVFVQHTPQTASADVPEKDWDYICPLELDGGQVGALVAHGPDVDGAENPALDFLATSLTSIMERALESRSLAQETLERYREINLLYSIGESISASLDPDEIPDLVMAEAARIIQADGGVVLLLDEEQELHIRSGFGDEDFRQMLFEIAAPLLEVDPQAMEAQIWTASQLEHPTVVVESIVQAPLKGREQVLGFVMLGREPQRPIFSADDEKLLTALAAQAAIAVENARLFADVSNQRDAIAEMKNYMDNIFASIASGVITTNTQDLVTLMNRAAERILGVSALQAEGRPYSEALPGMGQEIRQLVNAIKQQEEALVSRELEPILPQRGAVVLRLNLSPLKDNQEKTNGVAIVVDDLTERRKLEAQARRIRSTFEQYVVPHVVEQLLSDPNSVRLGGSRREITTLFADIRGFTTFGERQEPEVLVDVLNRYLTLASEVILSEEGTLDKFFGDGVMAIFNAPLVQEDHALRAVRTALAMRASVVEAHRILPREHCLDFGIGITNGLAVVGSIGSTSIKNYTAIGDCVNLAARLQNHAEPGQILLDAAAYQKVQQEVTARSLGEVHVKGHTEPVVVYEVLGLV